VTPTAKVFADTVEGHPVPGFNFLNPEDGDLYACESPTSTASPSGIVRYFEWNHKIIRCYRLAQREEQPHVPHEHQPTVTTPLTTTTATTSNR